MVPYIPYRTVLYFCVVLYILYCTRGDAVHGDTVIHQYSTLCTLYVYTYSTVLYYTVCTVVLLYCIDFNLMLCVICYSYKLSEGLIL